MNKGVKISIQVTVKDMYQFLMVNSYYGMKSVFGLSISACALVLLLSGVITATWLYFTVFAICLLFPVLLPLLLWIRSIDLVLLKGAKGKVLQYHFTKEGILLKQEEQQLELRWEDVLRALETKSGFYLYITNTSALVLPKNQYEARVSSLRYLLKEQVPEKRLKLK